MSFQPKREFSTFENHIRIRWLIGTLLVLVLCVPESLARSPRTKGHSKRPARGFLVVTSMTTDAKVYVDGKLLGKTPFSKPISLRAGKHKLRATKSGHSNADLNFVIRPGRRTELSVDLIPFSGLVRFSCNEERAEVYVDKKLVGIAPLNQDLMVGDHDVQIVKEGHNDFVTKINVKAGEKHFVNGTLTPFQDLSPEVAALAKSQTEKTTTVSELAPVEPVPPAPAWYADLYKKWWVWAIAGAVVVTAVTVPLAVSGGRQPGLDLHEDSPHTIIDPGKK